MFLLDFVSLHPATVHMPIGLLILASAAGLLYLHWQQVPQLKVLTWWPMLIGWISCVLAVLTGLLAQSGLPPDAPYWQLLNSHVTTGLAILLLYGTPLYLRWIRQNTVESQPDEHDVLLDSNAWRTRLWLSLFLIIGAVLVLLTGWSGGQLVYTWGVGISN